ncbi:MAG: hypothetical protein Q9166_007008 [cf. Caloplaca sp. 2 TL-2023]
MNEAEAGPYSAIPGPAATPTLAPGYLTSPASSTTHSASSSSVAASSSSTTSHTSIGAVVGGIVGGLAAITLLAALAIFLVRRSRQRRSSTAIALSGSDKATPAPSYQESSTFPTPVHELETPPLDPWYTPNGKAYEMPSPDFGGEEQTMGKDSKGGLGIYRPYKPAGKEREGRYGLYDEGRNISYELDGRGIDRKSKGQI